MGLAVEVISGRIANAAAFAAFTANTDDTFKVRAFPEQVGARLEDVWGEQATSQTLRIRSPRMHDSTNGLRLVTFAGQVRGLLPHEAEEPLYPTDELTVESSGTPAEVDVIGMLLYYRDLAGIDAHLEGWEAIKPRVAHILSLEVDVAAPAVSGNYSAGVGIDSLVGALKANTDYAIVGYLVDSQCAVVGFKGIATGNLRIGGPGSGEADDTREWFIRQSLLHGTPHIPIFNSNDKDNVLVSVAKVALTATKVTAILAELS